MRLAKVPSWMLLVALLILQVIQVAVIVHRESLTWDEDDHMFAGYMMGHTGDYGLNPEHPPLVKLLAAAPLFGHTFWVPPLQGRDFKVEAYLDGRDWLARNDGASQNMVLAMRASAGILALALSLLVYFATREWFGERAALLAVLLLVFDPNILAHSALVTTDIGVSLFFLASIYFFYRYVKAPSLVRLILAGLIAGLLLATKHSGILLAPMLLLLTSIEIAVASKGNRGRLALRLGGALAVIVVIGVTVLWAFYGFRYAARPAGLLLSTPLADYARPLSPFSSGAVMAFARLHLLPESYLMGLVDVKRMAEFYPTFVLGKVYAHGQWWYFPVVMLVKTTLGLMGLLVVAVIAICARWLRQSRELIYLLLPGVVYLAVAMASGMNIGARHILPLYAMAAILAGAGAVAFLEFASAKGRTWSRAAKWTVVALVLAHVISGLSVFPNSMAYANEAWGGPRNLHNLLSDANVDWAQQLIQVKQWQDRHAGEQCWFAYFAYPEVDPAVYGIRCHVLPTGDTFWMGGAELVPPTISGNVLISAGDLSGCEWPSAQVNPYRNFQSIPPAEMIDYGVMVYRGRFAVNQAAALSRAQIAYQLLGKGKPQEALALAREAVAIDPTEINSQNSLGDIALVLGQKDQARNAWQTALTSARHLEQDAQLSYVPDLERKLKNL